MAGSLLFSACQKINPDMNIDPNSPTSVPTNTLLIQAERALSNEIWDEWNNGRFGLLYAQYWAQADYSDESRYQYRVGAVNSFWNAMYSGGLMDLAQIKKVNLASTAYGPKLKNENAIATLLQSYYLQMITDIWGNAPMSEALRGQEITRPKYDSQMDIYVQLINNVQAAIADIDPAAGNSFGSADYIYFGDMDAWTKFGNALLMRMCLRVADRQSEMSSAGIDIASIYSTAMSNTLASNADNAMFKYLSAQPNTNPLYADRIVRGDADFGMSNTLIDVLNGTALVPDPRLEYYADTTAKGNYNGIPYGMNSANLGSGAVDFDSVSYPSGADGVRSGAAWGPMDVLKPDAPAMLLDFAEVCFMNAEAAERGWISTMPAADYYTAGITASIDYWSGGAADPAVVTAYLASPNVSYATAPGSWKEKIGLQKWIALYMQGVQGWTEWRRLDFGVLQLPVDGVANGTGIPNRYAYPTQEQTVNGANYTQAVLSQGSDNQTTKLWWDVN